MLRRKKIRRRKSEGRSQTSVTRALRAAMTSAEFQRRDASRARGPKVSTGMLAHGFVPWRICRERERETVWRGIAAEGGVGGGGVRRRVGGVGRRVRSATTPNPRRERFRTPIFVPQPPWREPPWSHYHIFPFISFSELL